MVLEELKCSFVSGILPWRGKASKEKRKKNKTEEIKSDHAKPSKQ